MFKNPPKIFAHLSALDSDNFVTSEYILNKTDTGVALLNRFCPHRMYPLADPGTHTGNILCQFHGLEWTKDGEAINSNKRIKCGKSTVGNSKLVFQNFQEPEYSWVNDIRNEENLKYSHSCYGNSTGSWLWMMEIQTDLWHIWKGGVHPELAAVTDLDTVKMESGNGWILQTHSDGWWLCIYPFTFIEWSLGCLAINTTTPNDINNEFGFTWTTQFYFDPATPEQKRTEFESLEYVFKQDVDAIEKQKGKYFPLKKSMNRLEDHCVHFGNWVTEHRLKN
jgi:phenylpropionate dioxygenase-like ring-hydroxylating dioxygenase large terminal subunit